MHYMTTFRSPIYMLLVFMATCFHVYAQTPVPTWNATTTYAEGDPVTHNNISYEAQQTTLGVEPGTNSAHWLTLDEAAAAKESPGSPPDGTPDASDVDGLGDPGSPSGASSGAKMVNAAVRGTVSSGEGARIIAFRLAIDSGASITTSEVLMRGIGPGLAAFGHTDYLPDPSLYVAKFLDAGGSENLTGGINDNWSTNSNAQDISTTAASASTVIAFADKDAAVQLALGEGFYSMPVESANGQSGVAWVGADMANSSDAARLTSCACRGNVGTGDSVMIIGFEIIGSTSDTVRVLVRGRGPSLKNLGVTSGVLANPTMYTDKFLDNGGKERVTGGTNDDWTSSSDATSIDGFAKLLDFGVGLDDKDCAAILTLSPGYYTSVISGVSGGTGIGWVSVDILE